MQLTSYLQASCHDTARLLSEYAEGELRGFRLWRVERHLAVCERCSAALRALRETIASLAALGRESELPARPELADAVVARIRAETGGGAPAA